MVGRDFNQTMDSYLERVRSDKSISYNTSKKKGKLEEEESVPKGITATSIYIIKKPKAWWLKLVERFTVKEEEDFEERPREEKTESAESEQEFEQEYDEIKQDEKKLTFFQRIARFFSSDVEEEYQDIDDEEKVETEGLERSQEITEKRKKQRKKPLSHRFLRILGINFEDEEPVIEAAEIKDTPSAEKMMEMKSDMKEIAIIATAAFKQLPKDRFELFKSSSDFNKFKEILRKNNIIKSSDKNENETP